MNLSTEWMLNSDVRRQRSSHYLQDDGGIGSRVAKWAAIVVVTGLLIAAADRWPMIGLLIDSADMIGIVLLGFGVVFLGALGALRI